MATYSIKEENTMEAAREVIPLAASHYEEVEDKSSIIPLNINWETLETFFKANLISLMVARAEGRVVGYFANLITDDFMTSKVVARELALYISPNHRNGSLFVKLMRATESALKKRGTTVQYLTFKAGHNTELPLRLGFSHTETTYQKILEE
jgi:hypothetical protein